ncbi:iron chaperone [Isoptericola jiangsuensis]|uniref:iron chaperone n=1 Tax=Isoptericola jiangsuensis TaxID=548579 RepID=UPI003AABA8E5
MGEVSEYVESLSGADRALVEGVYGRARALVPDAQEGRSYGMPALRYRGRPLVAARASADHVGLYPFSSDVLAAEAEALAGLRTTKGSVSLDRDAALPADVVDRLVTARRDEIDAAEDS